VIARAGRDHRGAPPRPKTWGPERPPSRRARGLSEYSAGLPGWRSRFRLTARGRGVIDCSRKTEGPPG
jgi:hypothetical protein